MSQLAQEQHPKQHPEKPSRSLKVLNEMETWLILVLITNLKKGENKMKT